MQIDVMLCDYAQVSGDKLFISGANIDRMGFPAGAPAPYLVTFAAAGVVRVPWTETNVEHTLSFKLQTQDGGNPQLPEGSGIGPDGIGGEMKFSVGRPPTMTHGDEQQVPFAFVFQGLPLMVIGRYVLAFALDGAGARNLSFTLEHQ